MDNVNGKQTVTTRNSTIKSLQNKELLRRNKIREIKSKEVVYNLDAYNLFQIIINTFIVKYIPCGIFHLSKCIHAKAMKSKSNLTGNPVLVC